MSLVDFDQFWFPGPGLSWEMMGTWPSLIDKQSEERFPETHSDPTYTPVQLLREHCVLLRSRNANRQRGRFVHDSSRFDNVLDGPHA